MEQMPPRIFSNERRNAVRRRARALFGQGASPSQYILLDMIEDIFERLNFLRHEPRKVLAIGDRTGELAYNFEEFSANEILVETVQPEDGFNEEAPYPEGGYDLIASLATLDTVNDLPGALIHMRQALAPGGLAIATFVGGASLQGLRHAMIAADGDRPASRMHPLIDHRSCPQLLQRAGWQDPVVDTRRLDVRYSSFDLLVSDLRHQAMTCQLASRAPSLTAEQRRIAAETFTDGADRVSVSFDIITLTGRRPSPRF